MQFDKMNRAMVATALCGAILAAVLAAQASAGEQPLAPEVTEFPGTTELFVGFNKSGFLVRSAGSEKETGLDRFALVARTTKSAIEGYSLVTWKPVDKAVAKWPQLELLEETRMRIAGVDALVLRQRVTRVAEQTGGEAAQWGFELVTFKRQAPKDGKQVVKKTTKETIEQGGARLVEDRRFPLVAACAPAQGTRYGVLFVPVFKKTKQGRVLEGIDAFLVTTPKERRAE